MPRPADPYCLGDRFSAHCGMKIVEVSEGYAVAEMTVSETHLNCNGIPHGGIYFALADLAFGAAHNYTQNNSVTLNANIEYIASAKLGSTIRAISREVTNGHKILRHHIEIRDEEDNLLTIVNCTGYKKELSSIK